MDAGRKEEEEKKINLREKNYLDHWRAVKFFQQPDSYIGFYVQHVSVLYYHHSYADIADCLAIH